MQHQGQNCISFQEFLTEHKITFSAISSRIFVFFQKYMHLQISLSLEVATLKYAEEEITGNSCQNNRIIICHDER